MEKEKRIEPIPVEQGQINALRKSTDWYKHKEIPNRFCAIRSQGSRNGEPCFVVFDEKWNSVSRYYTCDERVGEIAYEQFNEKEMSTGNWLPIKPEMVIPGIKEEIEMAFNSGTCYIGDISFD